MALPKKNILEWERILRLFLRMRDWGKHTRIIKGVLGWKQYTDILQRLVSITKKAQAKFTVREATDQGHRIYSLELEELSPLP